MATTQIQQGKQQQDIANQNAQTLRLQEQDARERGALAEQQHRAKVAQIQGQQRAAMGASGSDLSSGSFTNLQDDTSMAGALDAGTIRTNALREAWGMKIQANNVQKQGRMALDDAYMGAMGTVLTGAGKAYGYSK